jgi:hypothetical protein
MNIIGEGSLDQRMKKSLHNSSKLFNIHGKKDEKKKKHKCLGLKRSPDFLRELKDVSPSSNYL